MLLVKPADVTTDALAPMFAGLTHPDCAALVAPLFRFAGKRGAAINFLKNFQNLKPLFALEI